MKLLRTAAILALTTPLVACEGFDRNDARDLLEAEPLPESYKIKMPNHAMECLEQGGFFSLKFPYTGVTEKGRSFLNGNKFPTLRGWEMSFFGPVYYKNVEILGVSGEEDSGRKLIQFSASYDVRAANGTGAEHCFVGLQKPPEKRAIAVQFDDGWRLSFPVSLY